MSRSVWKGPFVELSLMKKVQKHKDQNIKKTDQNVVKKINNYSRIYWNDF